MVPSTGSIMRICKRFKGSRPHSAKKASSTGADNASTFWVGVQWLAPLGLFRFSYAYPLNEFKGNDRYYGDQIERFQFSIGQAF